MAVKTVYCGYDPKKDHWYLSKFDQTNDGRPCNYYPTKDDAVRHAAGRGLSVKMESADV